MFILMIILTAFLCGLNNIYVPYQETERLGKYAGVEAGQEGGSLGILGKRGTCTKVRGYVWRLARLPPWLAHGGDFERGGRRG